MRFLAILLCFGMAAALPKPYEDVGGTAEDVNIDHMIALLGEGAFDSSSSQSSSSSASQLTKVETSESTYFISTGGNKITEITVAEADDYGLTCLPAGALTESANIIIQESVDESEVAGQTAESAAAASSASEGAAASSAAAGDVATSASASSVGAASSSAASGDASSSSAAPGDASSSSAASGDASSSSAAAGDAASSSAASGDASSSSAAAGDAASSSAASGDAASSSAAAGDAASSSAASGDAASASAASGDAAPSSAAAGDAASSSTASGDAAASSAASGDAASSSAASGDAAASSAASGDAASSSAASGDAASSSAASGDAAASSAASGDAASSSAASGDAAASSAASGDAASSSAASGDAATSSAASGDAASSASPASESSSSTAQITKGGYEESEPYEEDSSEVELVGECVPYYLCRNGDIVTDGAGLIDIRFSSDYGEDSKSNSHCPNFLDVMCRDPLSEPDPELMQELIDYEYVPSCGHRNPEGVGIILDGFKEGESQFAEFPWMAIILEDELIDYDQVIQRYVCGASLIHPQVILTGAHCVNGKDATKLIVRLGDWDTHNEKEIFTHEQHRVVGMTVHERFNSANLRYDVALLFLEEPVELKEHIDTLCLPEENEELDYSSCVATGFGKDQFHGGQFQNIMKQVDLSVVSHKACQKKLQSTRLGRWFRLHRTFTCAGGEGGVDTCRGDGGSPLACPRKEDPNKYVQAGIVAWGIGCGEDGVPGVYASVPKLVRWVNEKIGDHFGTTEPEVAHAYGLVPPV